MKTGFGANSTSSGRPTLSEADDAHAGALGLEAVEQLVCEK